MVTMAQGNRQQERIQYLLQRLLQAQGEGVGAPRWEVTSGLDNEKIIM
jgi:hypothetical protein